MLHLRVHAKANTMKSPIVPTQATVTDVTVALSLEEQRLLMRAAHGWAGALPIIEGKEGLAGDVDNFGVIDGTVAWVRLANKHSESCQGNGRFSAHLQLIAPDVMMSTKGSASGSASVFQLAATLLLKLTGLLPWHRIPSECGVMDAFGFMMNNSPLLSVPDSLPAGMEGMTYMLDFIRAGLSPVATRPTPEQALAALTVEGGLPFVIQWHAATVASSTVQSMAAELNVILDTYPHTFTVYDSVLKGDLHRPNTEPGLRLLMKEVAQAQAAAREQRGLDFGAGFRRRDALSDAEHQELDELLDATLIDKDIERAFAVHAERERERAERADAERRRAKRDRALIAFAKHVLAERGLDLDDPECDWY